MQMIKNKIYSLLLAAIIGTALITACSPTSNEETITQTVDNESETEEDLQEEKRIAKYKSLAKITFEEAKKAGETAIGGKANEVELDIENGGLVYDVEVGNKEAIIDAGNGKVLYVQDEEAEEKTKVDKPRSSIRIPETD